MNENEPAETPDSPGTPEPPAAKPMANDKETRTWSMLIHFSVLASWAIPIAGIVIPIMIWQIKKDELPGILPHAHIVMNWIVTSIVYSIIFFILTFLFIGIFGFIALALATLVFSIIGGIKANEGEVWEYPGTFIKVFN